MKILQVIHGYPPEYNAGSEVYTRTISEWLAQHHEVVVFSRYENELEPNFTLRKSLRNGVRVIQINMAREKGAYQISAVDQAIGTLLAQEKPDLVHFGHLSHLSMGLVRVVKDHGIPVVFTLHDFWLMCPRGQFLQHNFEAATPYPLCTHQENQKCATACYSRFMSNDEFRSTEEEFWAQWIGKRMDYARQIVQEVDLFIAPSQQLRQKFVEEFQVPESKIIFLPYGFPLHYLGPIHNKPRRPFTFGYIGTHIPAKGIDLLIRAYAALPANQDVNLLIYGRHRSATDYLQSLAKDSPNPISFADEYQNQDIRAAVFEQVDAIVVPSIWLENAPLVIHEAQACHIPVITANVGGMAELVAHQANGLLFEHRDSDSLSAQLKYASEHPQAMIALGKRGYLHHPQGLVPDIDSHGRALESHYQQLIKEPHVQPA